MVRVTRLSVLCFLYSGHLLAAEPAARLEGELLHITYPMHVASEGLKEDPLGYGRPTKATIAPRIECRSDILRGPVFDVAEWLRRNGLILPKGSRAYYSPKAELFYLSSTPEDVELARTFVSPSRDGRDRHTCDVELLVKQSGKPEASILEIKSAPLVSGQVMKFRVGGESAAELELEPVIGPDGETMEIGVKGSVTMSGKNVAIALTWTTAMSPKPDELTLGNFGKAVAVLRFQTHRQAEYWGSPILATPEAKAKAIKEIETSLQTDH